MSALARLLRGSARLVRQNYMDAAILGAWGTLLVLESERDALRDLRIATELSCHSCKYMSSRFWAGSLLLRCT